MVIIYGFKLICFLLSWPTKSLRTWYFNVLLAKRVKYKKREIKRGGVLISPRCGISPRFHRGHTVFGNEKYCIMKFMVRNGVSWWQKMIFLVALFLGAALVFSPQVQAKEYSIDSVLINAIVQPDGSMEVTEQRVYDFQDDFKFAYEDIYQRPG